jgi:hypothetical protein
MKKILVNPSLLCRGNLIVAVGTLSVKVGHATGIRLQVFFITDHVQEGLCTPV